MVITNLFSRIKRENTRLCLHHYDNGDREFLRRNIIGAGVSDIDNTGAPVKSWIDYYQTLYPFNGYGGVPADAVQFTCDRHFFLQFHEILPADLLPPEDNAMDSPYISAIADARVMEITKSARPHNIYNKVIVFLGVTLLLEMIIWGIQYAR